MNYTMAILTVRRYINETLSVPRNSWSKRDFETRTYSRWAANEIMERLMEEELKLPYHISGIEAKTPIEIVDGFIEEMDVAVESTNNSDHKFMFSTARHTADEVLLQLYFGKG